MARRKTNTFADNMLIFADLLTTGAGILARVVGDIERKQRRTIQAVIDMHRAENLRLKNAHLTQRIATEINTTAIKSNQIVITDQKIERNELELAREREKNRVLGLPVGNSPTASPPLAFQPMHYADPGDVRRGKLPHSWDCNQFPPA